MRQFVLTQMRRMLIKEDSKFHLLSPGCVDALKVKHIVIFVFTRKNGLLRSIKIEKERSVLRILALLVANIAHKLQGLMHLVL